MNKILLIICLLFISCRDKVVLLGDSTMAGKYIAPIMRDAFEYMHMNVANMNVTNMAVIGQSAYQLKWKLGLGGGLVIKNSIVCVLIGVNDVLNGYQDYQVCTDLLRIIADLKDNN